MYFRVCLSAKMSKCWRNIFPLVASPGKEIWLTRKKKYRAKNPRLFSMQVLVYLTLFHLFGRQNESYQSVTTPLPLYALFEDQASSEVKIISYVQGTWAWHIRLWFLVLNYIF